MVRVVVVAARWLLVAGVLAAGAPGRAWCQDGSGKPDVAVMPFDLRKLDVELGNTLTDTFQITFAKVTGLNVIGQMDISAMVGLEKEKQLLACAEGSCLAEIGGALGVRYIVTGRFAGVGDSWVITVKLIDVQRASVVLSDQETVDSPGEKELLKAVQELAQRFAVAAKAKTAAKVTAPVAPPPAAAAPPQAPAPAEDRPGGAPPPVAPPVEPPAPPEPTPSVDQDGPGPLEDVADLSESRGGGAPVQPWKVSQLAHCCTGCWWCGSTVPVNCCASMACLGVLYNYQDLLGLGFLGAAVGVVMSGLPLALGCAGGPATLVWFLLRGKFEGSEPEPPAPVTTPQKTRPTSGPGPVTPVATPAPEEPVPQAQPVEEPAPEFKPPADDKAETAKPKKKGKKKGGR
jgi:TolB-like protein